MAYRWVCAALVAVGTATACVRAPSDREDDYVADLFKDVHRLRTVEGRTYTTQPVEASVGPHRFQFPANLYFNQIGPFAGGGVVLTVMWPALRAAPPGNYPLRSEEDGYREVSIELRYLGSGRAADYLAPDLTGRVALPTRWGLTPYAVDRERVGRDVLETAPDWYVVRDGDGRVTTFISCDPWEYTVDGVMLEGGRLVRGSGDRVAMCWHSALDAEHWTGMEMRYARVLLMDWQRMEATSRELLRGHRTVR
ncbi:hypothetical protein [Stenotrophomonas sp.]|uniref:hypothetical protein n=1 Tax=Stenotrophomonas sp. TaxID=69392 RepID=UPI002D49D020|nr:hypothetical protein [Stenotrophomonas sp.]HYQ23731.1 hypothetical protein [Stenotrophomonas sp.]